MEIKDLIYAIMPFIGFGLFALFFVGMKNHVHRKQRKAYLKSNTKEPEPISVSPTITQRHRELALQLMYVVHGQKFVDSLNDKDYFEMVDKAAKEMYERVNS